MEVQLDGLKDSIELLLTDISNKGEQITTMSKKQQDLEQSIQEINQKKSEINTLLQERIKEMFSLKQQQEK